MPRSLIPLAALLGVLSSSPGEAAPFPTPRTAAQLACNLSDRANPSEYRAWWSRVPGNATYRRWFWSDIVPAERSSACAAETARLFWYRAVPENWDRRPNIGGWPWAGGGGYFTQTLWLQAIPDDWGRSSVDDLTGAHSPDGYYAEVFWARAVPEEWAPMRDLGGWGRTGGYYTQFLWLSAIPDNWASRPRLSGWPWSSGGYYTMQFWLHAVPDNWASRPAVAGWPWSSGGYYTMQFWLHAVPDNWAPAYRLGRNFYAQDGQGYYRYWFWEQAVPADWARRSNVGGYPYASGGYYTQWFWVRAVVDDWASSTDYVIGGTRGHGHYRYWMYHFAVPRGFAHRASTLIEGQRGASYYHERLRNLFRYRSTELAELWRQTQGYLPRTPGPDTVDRWFDPSARAVVVLSFDTEGNADQSCGLSAMLRRRGVAASFMLTGRTAEYVRSDARWHRCLQGFDLGNHTEDHYGNHGFRVPSRETEMGLFNMYDGWQQALQVIIAGQQIQRTFGVTPRTFRTPWCDGHKSLDEGVLRTLAGQGIELDSSMANVAQVNIDAGLVPPADLRHLGRVQSPYPFVFEDGRGREVVEVPFAYPSDWFARNVHGLDTSSRPPNVTDMRYAPNVWAEVLDETIALRGVMVLVLHPHSITPASVEAFIDRVRARPGVRFTTLGVVNQRYRRYRGL